MTESQTRSPLSGPESRQIRCSESPAAGPITLRAANGRPFPGGAWASTG